MAARPAGSVPRVETDPAPQQDASAARRRGQGGHQGGHQAVGILLVIEDVRRDPHTAEPLRHIDALGRQGADQAAGNALAEVEAQEA